MRIWHGQPQKNEWRSVFSGDFHVRARGVMFLGSLEDRERQRQQCALRGVDANGYDVMTGGKAQIGGCGGVGFDDIEGGRAVKGGSDKTRITSVTVNHGNIVDSISVAYGANFPVKHGGGGGTAKTLYLGSGEGIGRVRVCSGDFVDSVEFLVVNAQGDHLRSWRAGGHGGRWCKTYCPEKKGDVVTGFQGSAAVYLDALGVYFGENKQSCPSKDRWIPRYCGIYKRIGFCKYPWMKDVWCKKTCC